MAQAASGMNRPRGWGGTSELRESEVSGPSGESAGLAGPTCRCSTTALPAQTLLTLNPPAWPSGTSALNRVAMTSPPV